MMLRVWDGLECDDEDGKGERIEKGAEGIARCGIGSGEKKRSDRVE